jgi:hypothetical protein
MTLLTDSSKTCEKLAQAILIRQHTLFLNNNLKHAKELGLNAEFFIREDSKLEVIITDPSRCHRKRNFYESQDDRFYRRIINRLMALYKLSRMRYDEHFHPEQTCKADR